MCIKDRSYLDVKYFPVTLVITEMLNTVHSLLVNNWIVERMQTSTFWLKRVSWVQTLNLKP